MNDFFKPLLLVRLIGLGWLLLIADLACSQPSFSTKIRFRLYTPQGQLVDWTQFQKQFKIADTFCYLIEPQYLGHHLKYDAETHYFTYTISTVVPKFSFALYHDDKVMAIFLPFYTKIRWEQYAFDIRMREGNFYLEFPEKKISNAPILDDFPKSTDKYLLIKRMKWKSLRKKFDQSPYREDAPCYRPPERY